MVEKIKVHVSVFEEETMTANSDKLAKEVRIIAKPVIKIDSRHTEQMVLDTMRQALGKRKYNVFWYKIKGIK